MNSVRNSPKEPPLLYNQEEALKDADFVYVKNWSTFTDYGKIYESDPKWMLTNKKLELTNQAKVMHCLPVRRNVELSDEILDGPQQYCNTGSREQGMGGPGGTGGIIKKQWINSIS